MRSIIPGLIALCVYNGRMQRRMVFRALWQIGKRGLLLGAVVGGVYGTLLFPFIGTILGVVYGGLVGGVVGVLDGVVFGLVTWHYFYPLTGVERYRWTMVFIGLVCTLAGSWVGFEVLMGFTDLYAPFQLAQIPALIAGLIGTVVGWEFASEYAGRKRKKKRGSGKVKRRWHD